jgi:hypothetical protein
MFMPGAGEYVRAADTLPAGPVPVRTAYPYRPLEQTAQEFLDLPINPKAMEKIVYSNIVELLKLG